MGTAANQIVVLGTGRSGTTIFHRMFSEHPDLAWFSRLCDRYPDKPYVHNTLLKSLRFAPLEGLLRRRYPPAECYRFWDYHCKGFSAPCRDLSSTDASDKTKRDVLEAVSRIATKDRNRQLIKITGWPRIGFLSEVFDQPKFIHVIRDGRAVANSLVNIGFWLGWGGPDKWRWGPLPETYRREWEDHNRSFVVLAAIQWKILMDATEEAKKQVATSDFLEVRYEDLCSDPISLFRRVAEFSQLEWKSHFEARLKSYRLKNTDHKYKQHLNARQQEDLEAVLEDHLTKYGYR